MRCCEHWVDSVMVWDFWRYWNVVSGFWMWSMQRSSDKRQKSVICIIMIRYLHLNCMSQAWYYPYLESNLWRSVWVTDLVTEILPEHCRWMLSKASVYIKKEGKKDSKEKMRKYKTNQDHLISTQLEYS